MNKSTIEAGQPGQQNNSEQTAQNRQVSQPNANVVGSLFKSREIKFRAWGRYGDWNEEGDERNWQMIDGDSLCFEDFKPICDLLESKEDEEYFMQYTGLKDKNGKEIYEGDINQDGGVVIWNNDDASFCWHYEGIETQPFGEENEWCEIRGNIFENPELLQTLR